MSGRGIGEHVRGRPVTAFIGLAFLISYGLGAAGLWVTAVQGRAWHPLVSHYLVRVLVVAGPALAALIVTRSTGGTVGMRWWLGGLRLSRRYLWIALVIPLATMLIAVAALLMVGIPVARIGGVLNAGWPLLVLTYVLQIGIVGLGEELGWRGWLFPTLRERHGIAGAIARVSAVWFLWHLPKLLGSATFTFSFAVLVLALSILFAALQLRTRSVLPVVVAHGAVNAPTMFLEGRLSGTEIMPYWYANCAIYAGIALVLCAIPRRQLIDCKLSTRPSLLPTAWPMCPPGLHSAATLTTR